MAQNGALTDCKNSGEPTTLFWHTSVAQGIDPAMQSMESASAQPGIDCVFTKAQLCQLSPRDDPVLAPCESTDLAV